MPPQAAPPGPAPTRGCAGSGKGTAVCLPTFQTPGQAEWEAVFLYKCHLKTNTYWLCPAAPTPGRVGAGTRPGHPRPGGWRLFQAREASDPPLLPVPHQSGQCLPWPEGSGLTPFATQNWGRTRLAWPVAPEAVFLPRAVPGSTLCPGQGQAQWVSLWREGLPGISGGSEGASQPQPFPGPHVGTTPPLHAGLWERVGPSSAGAVRFFFQRARTGVPAHSLGLEPEGSEASWGVVWPCTVGPPPARQPSVEAMWHFVLLEQKTAPALSLPGSIPGPQGPPGGPRVVGTALPTKLLCTPAHCALPPGAPRDPAGSLWAGTGGCIRGSSV